MSEITEVDTAFVRAWARKKGFKVGNRGHLPEEVVEAFNKAHRTKRYTSGNPSVHPELVSA